MPKLFMRDFEPHFNDDLYKVTNWNNWDRHTEAELYRGCAIKYALQFGSVFVTAIMTTLALLFFIGGLTDTTLLDSNTLMRGMILTVYLCIGLGMSFFAGADKIINLYLSNLDRVQETQDIQVEDD